MAKTVDPLEYAKDRLRAAGIAGEEWPRGDYSAAMHQAFALYVVGRALTAIAAVGFAAVCEYRVRQSEEKT